MKSSFSLALSFLLGSGMTIALMILTRHQSSSSEPAQANEAARSSILCVQSTEDRSPLLGESDRAIASEAAEMEGSPEHLAALLEQARPLLSAMIATGNGSGEAPPEAIPGELPAEEQDRRRLAAKARQVECQARSQLNSLRARYDLDAHQQDQLFALFVRHAPGYDPRMRMEGVSEAAAAMGTFAGHANKEDLLKAILRSDQRSAYEQRRLKWQRRMRVHVHVQGD